MMNTPSDLSTGRSGEPPVLERQGSGSNILAGITFGVGTWSWGYRLFWGYGSGYGPEDLRQVFDASLAAGIRLFDTAEVYGQGKSEQMLGEFLRDLPEERRARVLVATKFMPFPWRLGRGSLSKALKASLNRMQIEQVDLYQVHQPLPPVTPETWMTAMAEAVQSGRVKAVGVSNYSQEWMQRAYDTLIREGIPLAANQVEYSLLERRVEKNGLLKLCKDLGITLIAYSPLAMGILTGKYSAANPPRGIRGRRYGRHLLEKTAPLITLLKHLGASHGGRTPAQVALNWCICKGTLPIPGAKNIQQAEQNAGALGWMLSESEVAALDEASDQAVNKD